MDVVSRSALAGGVDGAAEGATPCSPTGGFAVTVGVGAVVGVGAAVEDVAVVEALPLGFPGAKVTKLGSMSGRLPLAL